MGAPEQLAITRQPAAAESKTLEKQPAAPGDFPPSTPEKKWPQLRTLQIESLEENEYVNLLTEMNWVMKHCTVKLLGRVGRREVRDVEMDKALARLNDSLHGVRHALQALFHLAGFRDYRFRVEETPAALPVAPEPQPTPKTPEIPTNPALPT